MALTITIAGVDKTSILTAFSSERTINATGTASFTLLDPATTYIPAEWAEVIVMDGATEVFSGYIVDVEVGFAVDFNGLQSSAEAVDFSAYLDRTLRNSIEDANLDILDHMTNVVVDNLATPYGIALAAGQVAGPTISTSITNAWATPRAFLDYLSVLSGYLYDLRRVSGVKTLEMFAIGARTATPALSAANGNILGASFTKTVTDYVNAVWLSHGGSQIASVTDPFSGDGVTRSWVMRYYVAVQPGSILVDSVTKTVGTYGVDTSMEWTFDMATRTLHQKNTFPVLTALNLIQVTFQAQFPNDIYQEDAAEVASKKLALIHLEAPDIVDVDEANAYAAAYIRQRTGSAPWILKVKTRQDGFDPGDIVTVSISAFGISSVQFFVQTVSTEYLNYAGGDFFYELDLVSGDERVATWLDWWKKQAGASVGASGSGGTSGTGGSSTTTIIGQKSYYLGGSYQDAKIAATAQPVFNPLEIELDSADYPSGVVVMGQVRTTNAGTTVTPVLQYDNAGTWTTVQAGDAVSSTAWTRFAFAATLISGTNYYRLALLGSNGTNPILGIGFLEGA